MLIDPPSASHLKLFPFTEAFTFVFVGGFVIPLPQEAILLAIGFFFADKGLPLSTAVLASVAAVIFSDNLFFLFSWFGSPLVLRIKRRLNPQTVEKYSRQMHAHAGRTIFYLRFIPGVRVLAPLLSGLFRVSVATYEFWNAAAAIIYVPAYVALGYYFHGSLDALIGSVETGQHAVFGVLLGALVIGLGWKTYRLLFKKKNSP